MRALRIFILAMTIAFSIGLNAPAYAQAGRGSSMGSRGTHTYVVMPGAAPIQRSVTPYSNPGYGGAFSTNGYGRSYGMRPGSAFTSGLLGGLLGAGFGGLLFGGGFFGGMHGGPGVLGLLLQMLLLYMAASWLYRRFAGGMSVAGAGVYGRVLYPDAARMPGVARPGLFGGGRTGRPISLLPDDYKSFSDTLRFIQAAWTAHDINALRTLTTPEMLGYFAEQLAEQTSRGVRNQVTDVHLLKGELSEAWSEGPREYATVSMTFSMVDATLDNVGRVLDGSLTERVTVTEFWTFLRAPRAHWVLSAIQQPR
jgi:predicted lipid-binding transport protein (Tim44 family)